jgi:hypothetical protein
MRQNARRGKSSTPVNDIFISLLIFLCPHLHFTDILLQIFFMVMPLILVFSLIWILQTISYLIIVIACEVAKPKHFYHFCQLSSYRSFFYASNLSMQFKLWLMKEVTFIHFPPSGAPALPQKVVFTSKRKHNTFLLKPYRITYGFACHRRRVGVVW